MTSEIAVDLHGLDAHALPRVGGKAANLGELIGAGFPVPAGFAVTTVAYAEIAAGLELDGTLDDAQLAEQARATLLAAPLPESIADAIRRAYAALGSDAPVAVRSSATAEDLPWASFAGQQDTYLNVVGASAVLHAVRRCWASLWTDRAVSYRASNGIDHSAVQLAVVVQRMVEARVAGVLFTADPVTSTRTRTVIDASPGLGEAVVSGAVNPDHVVVEEDGNGGVTVLEHRVGDKAVEVRPLPGGGTELVARADAGTQPCLTEDQVRDLVALGRRVEAHFGTPQDIEWAIDGHGALWLTQSRPITTLHPLPGATADGLRVFFCFSLAQGLTRPLTPMGLSAFRVMASTVARIGFDLKVPDPVAGPPAFRVAGGRPFIDITGVLRSSIGREALPKLFDGMESRSAVVLRSLFDDPRLAVLPASRWRVARRLLPMLARFRVPVTVARAVVNPPAARRRIDRLGEQLRALPTAPDVTGPQRLDQVVRVLSEVFPTVPSGVMPVAATGLGLLAVARRFAGEEFDEEAVHEVLRSLPHNTTTQMDLELWALATRIRADGDAAAALRGTAPDELALAYHDGGLPPALQAGLAEFLARHGYRAVAEIDLGIPRWSEDPTHVLGVLANYLRLEDPALAPDAMFARGALAADAAVSSVVTRVRRRSRVRAIAVRAALRRVRELGGLRETPKDYLVLLLVHARQQIAAVGEELADRGLLDAADDVFFLDLAEARSALDGADHRVIVAARREDYQRELRRRHVPRVLLSDGTEPEATAGSADLDGALAGTVASAGIVTAPARVVLDPVGAHLEPGEILVAPSTDPGWTPLFLTAGGLVMEMGGPNSHGAVVAREYGIPAVVGAAGATARISTGQLVTIDGAAGLVRPHEASPSEAAPPVSAGSAATE
jgi:pyruvate,water dikinase